jgi:ubiquitin C-terminal hydrolase
MEIISGREFVARELERVAKSIRNMDVLTDEEWRSIKDSWKCPKCGLKNWDID